MSYQPTHGRDTRPSFPRDREWAVLQSRVANLTMALRTVRTMPANMEDVPPSMEAEITALISEATAWRDALYAASRR